MGGGSGLAAFVVVVLPGHWLLLRGRSNSFDELGRWAVVLWLLAFPVLGASLSIVLNAKLDPSPVVVHCAMILAIGEHDDDGTSVKRVELTS